MRVLILANFGLGLYKFRKELIEELLHSNHEVIFSLPYDEVYVPLIEQLGCKYIPTNVDRRGLNPLADLRLFIQYLFLLRKEKVDIVLTYTIKPNIYGGMAASLCNKPFLTNITGLGNALQNKGILSSLLSFLYKLSTNKSQCVFFQNESNMKFFLDNVTIPNRYDIIPGSGVNLQQFEFQPYPSENNTITLLFIGRLMKAKGMDELFNAINYLGEKYNQNIKFNIVGFCEDNYSMQLEQVKSKTYFQYYGEQKDVRPFIAASHAIVLPSYHEGMANVLLEAAAMGRPIIASNIPGCMETFDEGISGFGFESKNSTSLIEAIDKFYNLSYVQKEKMGKSSRRKIEQVFDRDIVIEAYLNEINKVKGDLL